MQFQPRIQRNYLFYALLLAVLAIGCRKSDSNLSSAAEISSYSIEGINTTVTINSDSNTVKVLFPENITDASAIVSDFSLSSGAEASINNVNQQSGISANSFYSDLSYTVVAANHNNKKIWTVRGTNNAYSYDYGLGRFILNSTVNDRDYDWYRDQGNTGVFSSVNCGPTSVTMAINWADSTFTGTPQQARAAYHPEGGWWYTDNINAYLNDHNIIHAIIPLSSDPAESRDILEKQLDAHRIIILCVDMNFVRLQISTKQRIDKFYTTSPGWGHFFVIKGFQKMENDTYFQVYDPYSFGATYSDGTIRGQSRFYRFEDIASATSNWWNYAFTIVKKGETLDGNTAGRAVDPKSITHMHGK